MLSVHQIIELTELHLRDTWHLGLAQPHGGSDDPWPATIPVRGKPNKHQSPSVAAVRHWVDSLEQWADGQQLTLQYAPLKTNAGHVRAPKSIIVPSVQRAASMVNNGWIEKIHTLQQRADHLRKRRLPAHVLPMVLHQTSHYNDRNFTLFRRTLHWLQRNPASGASPRQIPVEGLDTKWLENGDHRRVLALALQLPDTTFEAFGLRLFHYRNMQFRYLDPTHIDRGGREYDSTVVGTVMQPAYQPRIVIITENSEIAYNFPLLKDAVVVMGQGNGGSTIVPDVPWVQAAELIVYWGDLDRQGFEILAEYRAAGLPVQSMLMDSQSVRRYARHGVDHDKSGARITQPEHLVPPAQLTDDELAAYWLVTTDKSIPARIEQERIPLDDAYVHVQVLAREEKA